MKTLIQKIHVEDQHSFACRKYRTPYFETNWHKHEEYELILITEGYGAALIGDYVGEYKTGDIFFLGSGLPHWFRKSHPKMTGSAIVIHFRKDFCGDRFFQLPEMKKILWLLENDNNGILLQKKLKQTIAALIPQIENTKGLNRISLLLNCLQQISESKQYTVITKAFNPSSNKENSAIEKIFTWSFLHYLHPVTLKEVAKEAGMSIPTFCRFFKRNIKKSYFDFLKELRIANACKLLRESNEPILNICYNSGYNSWAHFSKQFKQVKEISPNQYRKLFKQNGEQS
ncbi:MAG: helix-turn-helix domain-containing protein [Chitinophagaceae bacterium]|nr:helix-turn-helix domain-containing protein [Chitinophagaceae bacterium]